MMISNKIYFKYVTIFRMRVEQIKKKQTQKSTHNFFEIIEFHLINLVSSYFLVIILNVKSFDVRSHDITKSKKERKKNRTYNF